MKKKTLIILLAAIALACLTATLLISSGSGVAGATPQGSSYRDRMMQPERVMDAVGVRAGMMIGEVGAGEGYFTLWLSKRVGESGKVYANDISERSLNRLKDRCVDDGIANVVTVVGEVADPLFPAGELDMAVMVYALHHFDEPVELLVNLKKYLKPTATVIVIEQDPEKTGSTHFLRKERTVELLEQAGYEFLRHETFLQQDYVSVFRVRH
jgi:ubiquinone/menaquinone biosynthesis C-methylase UbiE